MSNRSASYLSGAALLRTLQLASPSLPIGAFAYSQGLESAVDREWVHDEKSTLGWILGLMENAQSRLDVPLLLALHDAWSVDDEVEVMNTSAFLLACRESRELRAEDLHLGSALARTLAALGVERARPWIDRPQATYAALFSLGACHWSVPRDACAVAYLFAWLEHQVSAAARLVPLGQLSAQRVLSAALERVPDCVSRAARLEREAIGFGTAGLAAASALHERQYTRLFRS
jgi:urease accessory protein